MAIYTVQPSSRWYLCTRKCPYVFHPASRKFTKRCVWNSSNVHLPNCVLWAKAHQFRSLISRWRCNQNRRHFIDHLTATLLQMSPYGCTNYCYPASPEGQKPCRHHHSTPHLQQLRWFPITERIKYKVACMYFHAINGSGPFYLSNASCLQSAPYASLLFWFSHIQDPKIQTQDACLSLLFLLGPYISSSLPLDLKDCWTLLPFKMKLKPFLFS